MFHEDTAYQFLSGLYHELTRNFSATNKDTVCRTEQTAFVGKDSIRLPTSEVSNHSPQGRCHSVALRPLLPCKFDDAQNAYQSGS